jgi:gliding-associated putative ABC transporter substrate-binding component GldG
LKGNQAASPAERLNQSVEGVEFELANGIKMASQNGGNRIAILSGHGETTDKRIQDLGLSLNQYYNAQSVDLTKVNDLSGYDIAILIKPTQFFSEFDKFKLDQFVVKGGKAIIMYDGIKAELDSIKPDGSLAFPYQTNLDDLLFRFGIRVNADLFNRKKYGCPLHSFCEYTGYICQSSYSENTLGFVVQIFPNRNISCETIF